MALDATTKSTTSNRPVSKPSAKKATAKKATAKKATARKATAKKAPARKATAKKAPAAKRTPVTKPRTIPAAPAVGALPAFVTAVPGRVVAALEDLPRPELPTAVVDLAEAAAKRGTDLAAAAAKRGADTVSTVQHGVTLFREAVGL